jgi:hypothetical protein
MAPSLAFFLRLAGLLLLVANTATAQQFDWVRTEPVNINFNNQFIRYPVAADAAGNVAVTGYQDNRVLTGTIVCGELGLVSYTPAGAVRFRRTLTAASALTQLRYDAAGNLIGLGIFKDSVRLGPRTVLRSSNTGVVPFLAKFDANGQALWAYDLNQLLGNIFSTCDGFATDPAGNIYLLCRHNGNDTELYRLDPNAQNRTVLLRQTRSRASNVSRAANGDLYLAGSCADPGATFGGVPTAPPYSYANFLARYTAQGVLRWVRFFEDITCGAPQVAADNNGGVFVAAPLLAANMHHGPFVTTRPNTSNELLLARLDTAGNWLWLRQPPTMPTATFGAAFLGATPSLVVDNQGNAVLAASQRGTLSWSTGSLSVGGTGTATDALLLSYGPSGVLRWVRTGGGPLVDDAHGLALAPNGDVYLSGYSTSGALAFGAAQGGPLVPANEFFVARLAVGTVTASRALQVGSSNWQVAPNPAEHAQTQVRFAAGAPVPQLLEMRDAVGRLVRSLPVTETGTTVPTSGLAPGLYFLEATAGSVRYRARLAVQ